jgi:UPF0042 nucleotide-binding protein
MRIPGLSRSKPSPPSGESGFAKTVFDSALASQRLLQVVLISGISGSGKSVALAALEDAGYWCVDNLPPELVPNLLAVAKRDQRGKIAIAVDVRSVSQPEKLAETLSPRGHDYEARVLFLEASTPTLVRRFSETRRRHPLSQAAHDTPEQSEHVLTEAIKLERELLAPIKNYAQSIDTSHLTPSQLRQWVRDAVQVPTAAITLVFESFGFKHGLPPEADIVFDARMLPNPYYDLALRSLTGLDREVEQFLEQQTAVREFIDDIAHIVGKWLPQFEREHRSYLTVAVGCTGGQHRSVHVVRKLSQRFAHLPAVLTRHRDMQAKRPS